MSTKLDVAVIGSGPNGLAAAVVLAKAGYSVEVYESFSRVGGGTRTEEFTLPGFRHDVCSAIHPMALVSPVFRRLNVERHGLEWIHPDLCLAHPLGDGSVAVLERSVEKTAARFDAASARSYRRVVESLAVSFPNLIQDLLAPPRIPRHPLDVMAFGLRALPSALAAARSWFTDESARALWVGNAAHSVLPLDSPIASNAIGLMLILAGHASGWPIIKGGSERLAEALLAELRAHGGEVQVHRKICRWSDLPTARTYLFDTTPSALVDIAGEHLPGRYVNRLRRYRQGPGIFKIDYALSEAVPWKSEECRRAGTVHLGGSVDEIVQSEREVNAGIHPERPFVLTAQQSVFDKTRAPEGKHTFWSYCHVPSGSAEDMTERIEAQIERYAPGFRDCVLARHVMSCTDYESYNPNLIGGDIVGGANDWRQLMTRPIVSLRPHETPNPSIFLCSASTPPGGGVHGMCGWWAAEAAQRYLEKVEKG